MALDKRPLLTIAIPTYNRSSLLRRNLESIQKSMCGFENMVEVVISDNNSDDDTATVIKDFEKYQYIKYYRNIENIGFNHNYIKLILYLPLLIFWYINN
jgi:glycosyltransferase involved in cell wall biosynthesis